MRIFHQKYRLIFSKPEKLEVEEIRGIAAKNDSDLDLTMKVLAVVQTEKEEEQYEENPMLMKLYQLRIIPAGWKLRVTQSVLVGPPHIPDCHTGRQLDHHRESGKEEVIRLIDDHREITVPAYPQAGVVLLSHPYNNQDDAVSHHAMRVAMGSVKEPDDRGSLKTDESFRKTGTGIAKTNLEAWSTAGQEMETSSQETEDRDSIGVLLSSTQKAAEDTKSTMEEAGSLGGNETVDQSTGTAGWPEIGTVAPHDEPLKLGVHGSHQHSHDEPLQLPAGLYNTSQQGDYLQVQVSTDLEYKYTAYPSTGLSPSYHTQSSPQQELGTVTNCGEEQNSHPQSIPQTFGTDDHEPHTAPLMASKGSSDAPEKDGSTSTPQYKTLGVTLVPSCSIRVEKDDMVGGNQENATEIQNYLE